MKRKLLVGLLSAVSALALSAPAAALDITPATPHLGTDETANLSEADIEAICGCAIDQLLYTAGPTDGEGGTFDSSYNTAFNGGDDGNENAVITYVAGQPVLNCGDCWLVVKDGASKPVGEEPPAQYLFDLDSLGWNGTDTINITGLWPDEGSISHLSIWSSPGETILTSESTEATTTSTTSETTQATVTPEPATLALLGSGLAITAARLRRRKKV